MHYGDAPHDLSPPGPSNAARCRRRSLISKTMLALLGLNSLIGVLAVLASPPPWSLFAAVFVGASYWIAGRFKVVRNTRRSILSLGFVVLSLLVVSGGAWAQAPTEIKIDDWVGNDFASSTGGLDLVAESSSTWHMCATWSNSTGGGTGVYYYGTTDTGDTWSKLLIHDGTGSGTNNQCAITLTTNNTVAIAYVDHSDSDNVHVAVSFDSGSTWQDQDTNEVAFSSRAQHAIDIKAGNGDGEWGVAFDDTTTVEIEFIHTTDSGSTYSAASAVGRNRAPLSLAYTTDDRWHIANVEGGADSPFLVTSTDDGSTWGSFEPMSNNGCGGDTYADIDLYGDGTTLWLGAKHDTPSLNGVATWCETSDEGATMTHHRWDHDALRGGTSTHRVRASGGSQYAVTFLGTAPGNLHWASREGSAGWETHLNLTSDVHSRMIGFDFAGSGTWMVGYVSSSGNLNATLIQSANPDLSASITGGRDVRVDYENDPTVYVKSDGSTASTGQISSFNKLLGSRQNRVACSGLNTGLVEYALTVTFDAQIIWGCLETGSNQPVLQRVASILGTGAQRTLVHSGAIEALDSTLANDVTAGGTVNRFHRVDVTQSGVGSKWRKTLAGLEHASMDHGSAKNHTWVISDTNGVRGYDHTGISIAGAPSVLGVAVAAHNNTVYVGNATSLASYSVTGGTLLELNSTLSGSRIGGLRLSKDGAYILTWSADQWRLHDSGNLSLLATETAGATIRACDMDVRNNRVYCVTDDNVYGWEVFASTVSISGPGPVDGENPVLVGPVSPGGQFGGESSFSDTPTTPTAPSGTLFPTDGLEGQLGSEGAAKAFLGLFLVLFAAAGFWAIGSNLGNSSDVSPFMPMTGAIGGFVAAVQFGFFPDWALMLLVIALIAGVVFLRRGS